MSLARSAAPIVLASLLAIAGGGVLTRYMAHNDSGTPASRRYPQPEAQPDWARRAALADAAEGERIYREGLGNTPSCATCHGEAGLPDRMAPYPRLAGQSAEYVAKQLEDYASGIRRNEQMTPIARALDPQQRAAAARYVASLPAVRPVLSAAVLQERGRTLDEVGDNAQAIPACGNCHGLRGQGEGAMLPPLAGQPAAYLASQLNAFRSQRRRNDTVEVMEGIASRLTPDDIQELAAYFSALAPQRP